MCAGAKGLNLSKFERLCKKFGMLIATVGRNLQHAAGNAKEAKAVCSSFKFGSITYEICERRIWGIHAPGEHSQKFIGNPTARARKMKIKLNFPKGTHINPMAKTVETAQDGRRAKRTQTRTRTRCQMKICSLLLPKAKNCAQKYHKYLIFTSHNVAPSGRMSVTASSCRPASAVVGVPAEIDKFQWLRFKIDIICAQFSAIGKCRVRDKIFISDLPARQPTAFAAKT